VALLARAAGLLGHLAEELRTPIAPAIYTAVDRHAVYRPASGDSGGEGNVEQR
jgi:citrate synthase